VNLHDIEQLEGRDLDAAIAEHVLGWKWCHVPPDLSGGNESDILVPPDLENSRRTLPPKGRLHAAFMVPEFHRDLTQTVGLAARKGFRTIDISQATPHRLPTIICRDILRHTLHKEQS